MDLWINVTVLRGSLDLKVRVTLLGNMPKEQKSNSVHQQRVVAATEFSIVLQVQDTKAIPARKKKAEICGRGVMGSRVELRRIWFSKLRAKQEFGVWNEVKNQKLLVRKWYIGYIEHSTLGELLLGQGVRGRTQNTTTKPSSPWRIYQTTVFNYLIGFYF